jgi:hypothetical protein
MPYQQYEIEYLFLKMELLRFRNDLNYLRNLMNLLPQEKLMDLMSEVVAVKEFINEALERKFAMVS